MWNCIKDHINEVRCSVERDEKDEEEEDNFRKEKMCPIFKVLLNNYYMAFYFYNLRNFIF